MILRFIKNLLPNRLERGLKGIDQFGNKYYEFKGDSSVLSGKPRRSVKAASENPADYETNNIPVQWRSWLTFVRIDPPTIDEIQLDQAKMESRILKAQQLEANRSSSSSVKQ